MTHTRLLPFDTSMRSSFMNGPPVPLKRKVHVFPSIFAVRTETISRFSDTESLVFSSTERLGRSAAKQSVSLFDETGTDADGEIANKGAAKNSIAQKKIKNSNNDANTDTILFISEVCAFIAALTPCVS